MSTITLTGKRDYSDIVTKIKLLHLNSSKPLREILKEVFQKKDFFTEDIDDILFLPFKVASFVDNLNGEATLETLLQDFIEDLSRLPGGLKPGESPSIEALMKEIGKQETPGLTSPTPANLIEANVEGLPFTIPVSQNLTNTAMTPVQSSFVKGAGVYKNHLLIQFHHSDKIWGYPLTTERAVQFFQELMASQSKGAWVWEKLLGKPSIYGMAKGKFYSYLKDGKWNYYTSKGAQFVHKEGRPAMFSYNPVGYAKGMNKQAFERISDEWREKKMEGYTERITPQTIQRWKKLGTLSKPWNLPTLRQVRPSKGSKRAGKGGEGSPLRRVLKEPKEEDRRKKLLKKIEGLEKPELLTKEEIDEIKKGKVKKLRKELSVLKKKGKYTNLQEQIQQEIDEILGTPKEKGKKEPKEPKKAKPPKKPKKAPKKPERGGEGEPEPEPSKKPDKPVREKAPKKTPKKAPKKTPKKPKKEKKEKVTKTEKTQLTSKSEKTFKKLIKKAGKLKKVESKKESREKKASYQEFLRDKLKALRERLKLTSSEAIKKSLRKTIKQLVERLKLLDRMDMLIPIGTLKKIGSLRSDSIDLNEFREDYSDSKHTVLHGAITRAGAFRYLINGKWKYLYKDWDNLKEVFERYDYIPLRGTEKTRSHHAETLGFATNFTFKEDTQQVFADVVILDELENVTTLLNPKQGYHVSIGFVDNVRGDTQLIQEVDHIAISLGNKEVGRCSTAGGLACAVGRRDMEDENVLLKHSWYYDNEKNKYIIVSADPEAIYEIEETRESVNVLRNLKIIKKCKDRQEAEKYLASLPKKKLDFIIQDAASIDENIETWINVLSKKKGKFIGQIGKTVYSGGIPSGFWDYWKSNKDKIKSSGLAVSKYRGEWQLSYWTKERQTKLPKIIKPKKQKLKEAVKDKLLKHQIEHTSKLAGILKVKGSALDASDTGTGKTYTSLAAAKQLGLKPIIIAPNSVQSGWKKALSHYGMEGTVVNWALIRSGKVRDEKGKSIKAKFLEKRDKQVNDTRYKWKLKEDQVVIFDEAHRAKNKGTLNSQMVIAAGNDNVKTMALSATIAEDPLKFYSLGRALKLFNNKSGFYDWARQYGCKNVYNSGARRNVFEFKGNEKDLKRLHDDMFGINAERMRISEIKDFPETLITPETHEMDKNSKKIQKAYDEMEKELKILKDKEEKISEDNHLAILQKHRQKIEMLKVPTFTELAKDYVDSGNSITLFVNYKDTANQLKEKLGEEAVLFTGDINAMEREKNRELFQSDKKRIFIATVPTAKEGIDLHDITGKHPRVSLISPSFSAQDMKQVFGRVQRAGGKSKSIQQLVFAADTIEEEVALKVAKKLKNIEAFNDGDLAAFTLEENAIKNANSNETCDNECKKEVKKTKKIMSASDWDDWDKVLKSTIEKFKKAGLNRSARSISMDKRIRAKRTVGNGVTEEEWRKHPNQSDKEGVDTPDMYCPVLEEDVLKTGTLIKIGELYAIR